MSIKAELAAFEKAPMDRPYFPQWGFASPIERHVSMLFLVAQIAKEHGNGAKPINILEIGSWVGGSLLTWAHGIRTFNGGNGSILAIDPLEPFRNVEVEKGAPNFARVMDLLLRNELPYRTLRHNIGFADIKGGASHLRESSRQIGDHLRDDHFDIVYVDGEHGYAGVMRDLQISSRVLADQGVLCGDDLEVQAHQLPSGFLDKNRDALDATIPGSTSAFHPGVTAAVDELFGPVEEHLGFWNVRRDGERFVPVRCPPTDVKIPGHIPERLHGHFNRHLAKMLASGGP
ncbi:MAG: class I SAM-dependent methyltransferase [Alphaproteobacteria bacterium]|jgi:predicted O-methyltransferase YrrM